MTDNDIARMVSEMYPFPEKNGKEVNSTEVLISRLAAIKGAKKVRDHYEKKIALIHLTGK